MKKLVLIGAALLLAGCETCLQRVAATEAVITRAYSATGKGYIAGTLDAGQTKAALMTIDAANVLADNAVPLCTAQDPTAYDYLNQAGNLLGDVKGVIGDYDVLRP